MAIVLITGTSTGIGFATVVACAARGDEVYATMRDPARAPQLQTLARQEGLPVSVLPLDVDNDASVHGAIEHLLAERGRIDVLVNNAGIAPMGAIEITRWRIPPRYGDQLFRGFAVYPGRLAHDVHTAPGLYYQRDLRRRTDRASGLGGLRGLQVRAGSPQ